MSSKIIHVRYLGLKIWWLSVSVLSALKHTSQRVRHQQTVLPENRKHSPKHQEYFVWRKEKIIITRFLLMCYFPICFSKLQLARDMVLWIPCIPASSFVNTILRFVAGTKQGRIKSKDFSPSVINNQHLQLQQMVFSSNNLQVSIACFHCNTLLSASPTVLGRQLSHTP